MKKLMKAILLPFESNKYFGEGDIIKNNDGSVEISSGIESDLTHGRFGQYLYIVDSEALIDVNQWVINNEQMLFKVELMQTTASERIIINCGAANFTESWIDECAKVIATNDLSIGELPKITTEDIQSWIDAGSPEEVEVEMADSVHYNLPEPLITDGHIVLSVEKKGPEKKMGLSEIELAFDKWMKAHSTSLFARKAWKAAIEWYKSQQGTVYTEEDMQKAFLDGHKDAHSAHPYNTINEWLVQYKINKSSARH